MGRPRKEAHPLNVYLEKDIFDRFNIFCQQYHYTKTAVVEQALDIYMKDPRMPSVMSIISRLFVAAQNGGMDPVGLLDSVVSNIEKTSQSQSVDNNTSVSEGEN